MTLYEMAYLENNGHERYIKLLKHYFQATSGDVYSTETINHSFLTLTNGLAEQVTTISMEYHILKLLREYVTTQWLAHNIAHKVIN